MPLVHIETNRLEYKFNVVSKYTVIKGDSATGKTTFYELVETMNINPATVRNLGDLKVFAVPTLFDNFRIENYENYVLVVDEECSLFKRKDVPSILKNSNNYFIIINRSLKINLAFLHDNDHYFYTMKTSGKFHTLEPLVIN